MKFQLFSIFCYTLLLLSCSGNIKSEKQSKTAFSPAETSQTLQTNPNLALFQNLIAGKVKEGVYLFSDGNTIPIKLRNYQKCGDKKGPKLIFNTTEEGLIVDIICEKEGERLLPPLCHVVVKGERISCRKGECDTCDFSGKFQQGGSQNLLFKGTKYTIPKFSLPKCDCP